LHSLLDHIRRQLEEEHPETNAAVVGINLPIGLIDQALADLDALEAAEQQFLDAAAKAESEHARAEIAERDAACIRDYPDGSLRYPNGEPFDVEALVHILDALKAAEQRAEIAEARAVQLQGDFDRAMAIAQRVEVAERARDEAMGEQDEEGIRSELGEQDE
jgi:hypothetical protein